MTIAEAMNHPSSEQTLLVLVYPVEIGPQCRSLNISQPLPALIMMGAPEVGYHRQKIRGKPLHHELIHKSEM
jgi:hypothetical protein